MNTYYVIDNQGFFTGTTVSMPMAHFSNDYKQILLKEPIEILPDVKYKLVSNKNNEYTLEPVIEAEKENA